MSMGLELKMGLKQELGLSQEQNLFLNITPLELEFAIDQALKQPDVPSDVSVVRDDVSEKDEGKKGSGKERFLQYLVISGRNKIVREKYLETPQIFVEKNQEGYTTKYNADLMERITKKMEELSMRKKESVSKEDKIEGLPKQFRKRHEWITDQQLRIVKYLCEKQDKYLQSDNFFDMVALTQEDIAEYIGYTSSTVSRLLRNLVVQLEDKRKIFVNDMVLSSDKLMQKQGLYVLGKLKNDSQYFSDGKWRVSDEKLAVIIKEGFGLELARRTVAKYRELLGDKKYSQRVAR